MIECGMELMERGTRFEGTQQELRLSKDFKEYEGNGLVISEDRRVYQTSRGLLSCLVPVAVSSESHEDVFLDWIDWPRFPPMGELAHLYDEFFAKFEREVLMLVGERREPTEDGGRWLYFVPPQVGTSGSVQWDSKEGAIEEFHAKAKWIGTIHVHPGFDATPSQVDVNEWADPLSTGVHVIFGRGGGYTISGAIEKRTFVVSKGNLAGFERCPVRWAQSKGLSLKTLLKTPPVVVQHPTLQAKADWISRALSTRDEVEEYCSHTGEWWERGGADEQGKGKQQWGAQDLLDRSGGLAVSTSDLGDLRLVVEGDRAWLLTATQYRQTVADCCSAGVSIPPIRRRVSIPWRA